MAVNNPFETSFENMTTQVQGVTKRVQKAAADAAAAVATDVKQQVGGQTEKPLVEQLGLQQVPAGQQKKIQDQAQQNLAQTRQNLEKINQEIKKARDERLRKQQEAEQVKTQEKQVKKVEEQKKKDDPIWKKVLKGKMGSREAGKRVGG